MATEEVVTQVPEHQTRVQQELAKLQDKRWIVYPVVMGIIVVAAASFTDAFSSLTATASDLASSDPAPEILIEEFSGRMLSLAITNPTSRIIAITGMRSIPYEYSVVQLDSTGEDRYQIEIDPFDIRQSAPFFASEVVKIPAGDLAAFAVRPYSTDRRVKDGWFLIEVDYMDTSGKHRLQPPYAFRLAGSGVSKLMRRESFECDHAKELRILEANHRRVLGSLERSTKAREKEQAQERRRLLAELGRYIPALEKECE